jgi:hypothetical protein
VGTDRRSRAAHHTRAPGRSGDGANR